MSFDEQTKHYLFSCVTIGCIRNLALDALATDIQFPCMYATNGCDMSLTYLQKGVHEENCDFRFVIKNTLKLVRVCVRMCMWVCMCVMECRISTLN